MTLYSSMTTLVLHIILVIVLLAHGTELALNHTADVHNSVDESVDILAHGKELAVNHAADDTDSTDELVDSLADKLVARVLNVCLLHHADLDYTTHAKVGSHTVPGALGHHLGTTFGCARRPCSPRSRSLQVDLCTTPSPVGFLQPRLRADFPGILVRVASRNTMYKRHMEMSPSEWLDEEEDRMLAEVLNEDLEEEAEKLDLNRTLALDPEMEEGRHEYKRHLLNPTPERLQHLVTQLKWRLSEGRGEALYEIGVEDDGALVGLTDADMHDSYETLKNMAAQLDAQVSIACDRQGKHGVTRTALVRERLKDATHLDIRITTVGNVDSGKSTLLGVLTQGVLDDGRGLARGHIFRHRHEAESGRTSSISHQILGFAADGSITNYASKDVRQTHSLPWSEIVNSAAKVVSFFDLAGHEKYLRTTLYGLTSYFPDYAMMVVDSHRGDIVGMTKEHLSIVLALKVPLFVALTKVDMSSEELLQKTLNAVTKMLKQQGKMPMVMRNEADVLTACEAIRGNTLAPIFLTSSVSGSSLDLLRLFLNHVPAGWSWEKKDGAGACVHLFESFHVPGSGTVVGGNIVSGIVATNQNMLLGPDSNGDFKDVIVKSVRNKRVGVNQVAAGQMGTFALKGRRWEVHREDIRSGMVLVDKNMHPRATWSFQAEVLILVHPTTVNLGYTPMIHCLSVRQVAVITNMTTEVLRTGDRATVTFQWLYRPEYLREGVMIVFREGRTKGIGMVTKILPTEPKMEHPKSLQRHERIEIHQAKEPKIPKQAKIPKEPKRANKPKTTKETSKPTKVKLSKLNKCHKQLKTVPTTSI